MRLTQIEVECYAGAKADETPRRFNLEGQTLEVNEVLDRWYQVESKPEWPRAYYFRFEPWTNANTCSSMISSRRMVFGAAMVRTGNVSKTRDRYAAGQSDGG